MEPAESGGFEHPVSASVNAALVDHHKSPFDNVADEELKARVEQELRKIAEPYRTAVVLRDIEELSYDEIAEITEVSLGTVKSRITRGRDALKKRLNALVEEIGPGLGFKVSRSTHEVGTQVSRGKEIEVTR